jgi:hypothetical protein
MRRTKHLARVLSLADRLAHLATVATISKRCRRRARRTMCGSRLCDGSNSGGRLVGMRCLLMAASGIGLETAAPNLLISDDFACC